MCYAMCNTADKTLVSETGPLQLVAALPLTDALQRQLDTLLATE